MTIEMKIRERNIEQNQNMSNYDKVKAFETLAFISENENEKEYWNEKAKNFWKKNVFSSYQTQSHCDRIRRARGLSFF